MSTLKKGSRLITVDGVTYRWRIRHKPTYHQLPPSTGPTSVISAPIPRSTVMRVNRPGPTRNAISRGPAVG